ncbi:unnamed protein product [Tilletia controversa]|uniref:Uncharacterized protein n=1 Tax=Tilletia controversa TaxID=13291 RepID=A0A8X7SVS4_9BASI|nr:hypothetical protein A4X06_0g5533 [Tilletia controversa]CAD6952257.1 unnamed protein product [Tilletia controversa]CAD6972653.1 unnamed protein product [Tilletia controversa]
MPRTNAHVTAYNDLIDTLFTVELDEILCEDLNDDETQGTRNDSLELPSLPSISEPVSLPSLSPISDVDDPVVDVQDVIIQELKDVQYACFWLRAAVLLHHAA